MNARGTVLLLVALISACGAGTKPGPSAETAEVSGPGSSSPGAATWTDSITGLEWQIDPAGETMGWDDARNHCAALGEGWRLPTVGELRSLIRGCSKTGAGGSCTVTDRCLPWSRCRNDDCGGCDPRTGSDDACSWPSELQGTCIWYWSSSPDEDRPLSAWYVFFDGGAVNVNGVLGEMQVRCVR
jgi:uncharacterized protein (TIGR02145 family)